MYVYVITNLRLYVLALGSVSLRRDIFKFYFRLRRVLIFSSLRGERILLKGFNCAKCAVFLITGLFSIVESRKPSFEVVRIVTLHLALGESCPDFISFRDSLQARLNLLDARIVTGTHSG